MKSIKKITENKVFKTIYNIFKIFIIVFAVSFILMVYLQRFTDNNVSIFKHRMFTVVSRSMEPKYTIGDVLFAKETESSKIKVGDDITYKGRLGDLRDKIVTHQVISIDNNSTGYIFHTRGLANLIEDPAIPEEDVYGVVVYRSVFLSLIYKIIANDIGFYLCIIIPVLVILTSEGVHSLMEREEKKRAKQNNS